MLFILIFTLNICNGILAGDTVVVETSLGPVRGKLVDDFITGAYYYAFQGIPYAEAPVGNLRFKAPVKKRAWRAIYDATKPGCVCPQPELFYSREQMNEDCLNFNIFTPANYQNRSLPVQVYIHGGNYKLQSGNAEPSHGPQLNILNNLILVTMNYRLGALGFLSTCNEEVPGNAGVKDVLLLLTIIKKDISKFGGDPNNVAIAGNGAGSAIAEMLMLTKKSDGLFQKAILISGSILSPEFLQIYPRRNVQLLIEELGLKCKNDITLLKELRNVDPFALVEAQKKIEQRDLNKGVRVLSLFKPTVEIPNDSAIITRPPLTMLQEGAILDIPIIIGFSNQEGLDVLPLTRREPGLVDNLNSNFELFIPRDIQYPQGSFERRNLARRIRDFYFYGGNITFATVQNWINLESDSRFTFYIDYFVELFKKKKTSPVYYYIFEASTQLNWYKKFENIIYPGAARNDLIGYIFVTRETEPAYKNLNFVSRKVQRAVGLNIRYFLYYGAPAPNPIVDSWPEAGMNRYHIRHDIEVVAIFERPIPRRIDFWRETYEEYFRSKYGDAYYFCTDQSVSAF